MAERAIKKARPAHRASDGPTNPLSRARRSSVVNFDPARSCPHHPERRERQGSQATFTRLAVTPAQIGEYRLPTVPPKEKRAFAGETCQAEALPPDTLANILRTAIEERVDQRVLDRVLRQERRARRELSKRFAP